MYEGDCAVIATNFFSATLRIKNEEIWAQVRKTFTAVVKTDDELKQIQRSISPSQRVSIGLRRKYEIVYGRLIRQAKRMPTKSFVHSTVY